MAKQVKTIMQDEKGRNILFQDKQTGEILDEPQFVKKIETGEYPDYHVRDNNGVKTPVSNPDNTERNNLG